MPTALLVRKHFAAAVDQARHGEPVRITRKGRSIAALVDIDTLRLVEEAEAAVVRKKIRGGLRFVTAASVWDLI